MRKLRSVVLLTSSLVLLNGCASLQSGSLPSDLEQRESSWKNVFNTSDDASTYEDRLSRGLYATVGIGPSRMEPDTSQLALWDPNDRVEPAGQITVGADISKHFAIEAHSADLGSAGLSPRGRINYHINGASALLYAGGNRDRFRRQGLTAYGRVGVGFLENTAIGDVPFIKQNGTHVLFGAGVEYMTPIGVGLRAEGFSFDKDARYAQLALMYRMGRKQRIIRPKLVAAPKPAPKPVIAAAAAPPPPPPPPVVVPEPNVCDGLSGVLDGVNFHTDSADITGASTWVLDEIASQLLSCDTVTAEISAHTDSIGEEAYNQALSERRARSVVGYLIKRGLPRDRLSAIAFGESRPIDSNLTTNGRSRNRRVEISVR